MYSDFCKRTNYHVACTRVRLLCSVYSCTRARGFDSTSSSPFLAAAAVTRIYCSKAKVPCYIPHATCDLLDAMPCARMRVRVAPSCPVLVCAVHAVPNAPRGRTSTPTVQLLKCAGSATSDVPKRRRKSDSTQLLSTMHCERDMYRFASSSPSGLQSSSGKAAFRSEHNSCAWGRAGPAFLATPLWCPESHLLACLGLIRHHSS